MRWHEWFAFGASIAAYLRWGFWGWLVVLVAYFVARVLWVAGSGIAAGFLREHRRLRHERLVRDVAAGIRAQRDDEER